MTFDSLNTSWSILRCIRDTQDKKINPNLPFELKKKLRKDSICNGPNPYDYQTSQGFVLESNLGTPTKLYTPSGSFQVECCTSKSDKTIEILKEKLGLEKFPCPNSETSSCWEITRLNERPTDAAKFRMHSSNQPYEQVTQMWKEFAKQNHDYVSYSQGRV